MTVDLILYPEAINRVRVRFAGIWGDSKWWVDVCLPEIAFLTAHQLITAVAVMVGRAAIFPVVLVIGHEMGVNVISLQNIWHGIVKWLQR